MRTRRPGNRNRPSAGEPKRLASVPDSSSGSGHAPGQERQTPGPGEEDDADASGLWHITLSVAGPALTRSEVRHALEQLAHEHPFLMTSRYAADHAEIRYWEEARDLQDAAAVALRLWGEYRSSAGLPPWNVVGLEIVDRRTYRQRLAEGYAPPPAALSVRPF